MEPQLLIAAPSNPSTYLQGLVRVVGALSGVSAPRGSVTLFIGDKEFVIFDPKFKERQNDYLIEFDFDFKDFLPPNLSQRQFHHIKLKYQDQEVSLTSPESHVMFTEKNAWEKPLGNYNYPDPSSLKIASNHLVIEGWAAKKGCTQKEVNIWMDGRKFPCPNINVWSPQIAQSFPSFENATRSQFSVAISRSDIFLRIWKKRKFHAEVTFSDGSIFKLPNVRFEWSKPAKLPEIKKDGSGIVFIANNLRATEGAPRVLFEIMRLSQSLGQKISVITPVGGELETSLREIGVKVYILPELYLAHISRLDIYNAQTKQATELIKELNPSVVFGNTIQAFWGISFAQSLGIKTLWLIHESVKPKDVFEELDPRARISFLEALDNADTLFVSGTTEKLFWTPKRNTEIIPNGVIPHRISAEARFNLRNEVRRRLKIPDHCPLILSVGTICHRKGQDFLVKALGNLKDIEFRALLVGGRQSDYLEELKNAIKDLGLSDKVFIQDETREVDRFYAAADLFAISSREESAPLVSLEALNWSLPIVSTDAFGLVEQLKDSGGALLSPVDDIAPYADNLAKMLQDKELRLKCGRKGKLWVEEKFNLETSLARYKQILEQYYR